MYGFKRCERSIILFTADCAITEWSLTPSDGAAETKSTADAEYTKTEDENTAISYTMAATDSTSITLIEGNEDNLFTFESNVLAVASGKQLDREVAETIVVKLK